jgi:predicted  nucleic acid-binding Zn-ribbon protein
MADVETRSTVRSNRSRQRSGDQLRQTRPYAGDRGCQRHGGGIQEITRTEEFNIFSDVLADLEETITSLDQELLAVNEEIDVLGTSELALSERYNSTLERLADAREQLDTSSAETLDQQLQRLLTEFQIISIRESLEAENSKLTRLERERDELQSRRTTLAARRDQMQIDA